MAGRVVGHGEVDGGKDELNSEVVGDNDDIHSSTVVGNNTDDDTADGVDVVWRMVAGIAEHSVRKAKVNPLSLLMNLLQSSLL